MHDAKISYFYSEVIVCGLQKRFWSFHDLWTKTKYLRPDSYMRYHGPELIHFSFA